MAAAQCLKLVCFLSNVELIFGFDQPLLQVLTQKGVEIIRINCLHLLKLTRKRLHGENKLCGD